jgi:hypothetical protein
MASTGKTFKRCGCRNQHGKRLEQHCPRLSERGRGTWYSHCFDARPGLPAVSNG